METNALRCEALRPQGGAPRARSGEQEANKGSFVHVMPLDPACPALAGRACSGQSEICNLKSEIG